MLSSPPSIALSPASIRSRVVLPEPLRPASVIRSRRSSLKEIPCSSGCPAMSLRRSDAVRRAIAADGKSRPRRAPPLGSRSRPMTRSLLVKLILLSTTFALVLAPAAFAENDGRGFYGATDDKVVTNAGFILIVLFPLVVFLMSMGQ